MDKLKPNPVVLLNPTDSNTPTTLTLIEEKYDWFSSIRWLFWGFSGEGKTTLAKTLTYNYSKVFKPEEILVWDVDGDISALSSSSPFKQIGFQIMSPWDMPDSFNGIVEWLYNVRKKGYKVLVIDSITSLLSILDEEMTRSSPFKTQRKEAFHRGVQGDIITSLIRGEYGQLSREGSHIARIIKKLGITIIATAWVRYPSDNDGNPVEDGLVIPDIMGVKLSERIGHYFSYVWYIYSQENKDKLSYKLLTNTSPIRDQKINIKKNPSGERPYFAKTRLHPDVIKNIDIKRYEDQGEEIFYKILGPIPNRKEGEEKELPVE